jgi:hypothetical protein
MPSSAIIRRTSPSLIESRVSAMLRSTAAREHRPR